MPPLSLHPRREDSDLDFSVPNDKLGYNKKLLEVTVTLAKPSQPSGGISGNITVMNFERSRASPSLVAWGEQNGFLPLLCHLLAPKIRQTLVSLLGCLNPMHRGPIRCITLALAPDSTLSAFNQLTLDRVAEPSLGKMTWQGQVPFTEVGDTNSPSAHPYHGWPRLS